MKLTVNQTLHGQYYIVWTQGLSHQAINNRNYNSLSTDRRVQDEVNMLWEGEGHSSLEDWIAPWLTVYLHWFKI